MPGYGDYAGQLMLAGDDDHSEFAFHGSKLSYDPVRYVTDNRLQHAVQFEQQAGAAVLHTEVLVDEDIYDRVGLKIEYWPDALNKRQLVMSLGLGKDDYRWVQKEGFWSHVF